MQHREPTTHNAAEAQEIARQAEVELAILLSIEQSLRLALQWMTRDRGNGHKLATLRFTARSFERHLTRTRVLADHGGYMHSITDANPHLASKVGALRGGRGKLQANFERIILRLEYVSPNDAAAFGEVCAERECYLEQLRTHSQKDKGVAPALLHPRRRWIRMRASKRAIDRAFSTGQVPRSEPKRTEAESLNTATGNTNRDVRTGDPGPHPIGVGFRTRQLF